MKPGQQSKILKYSQILAILMLLALILIPLGMVLLRSFLLDGDWSLQAPLDVLMDPGLVSVYLNSIQLGLWVVLGTTLLALPLAFIMTKTPIGRHGWLDLLLLVPFMTPPYIGSMGWILFMQPRGFLDQFLPAFSFMQPAFFSVFGISMIMSFHLFPFLYLILKNALIEISGSLEEAGAIHGGDFLYRLRRIIAPLIFSPYSMGVLLVFVKTISEFGTPATLGRRVGYYVLTTEIYRYTSNWPIDFGKAASVSSILLGTSLMVWALQNAITKKKTYHTVGGKSRASRQYSSRKVQWLSAAYCGLIMAFAIGIPYFSIIATSLMDLRGYGLQLNNLTLNHYQQILTLGSSGLSVIATSVRLSLMSATLALILGTLLALVIIPSKGFPRSLIDSSCLLSNTVPSVVIIVGMILFWNARWNFISIYNTSFMLVLAYTVLFLPFTVQYVKSSLQQIDQSLYQAARVGGASPFYLFRRIILPLIRPGMVAGWIMTFIISVRELIASLMIRPPGLETTATFIYREFEQGNASSGMAMAVITVGLTTIIMLSVQKLQKRV